MCAVRECLANLGGAVSEWEFVLMLCVVLCHRFCRDSERDWGYSKVVAGRNCKQLPRDVPLPDRVQPWDCIGQTMRPTKCVFIQHSSYMDHSLLCVVFLFLVHHPHKNIHVC